MLNTLFSSSLTLWITPQAAENISSAPQTPTQRGFISPQLIIHCVFCRSTGRPLPRAERRDDKLMETFNGKRFESKLITFLCHVFFSLKKTKNVPPSLASCLTKWRMNDYNDWRNAACYHLLCFFCVSFNTIHIKHVCVLCEVLKVTYCI